MAEPFDARSAPETTVLRQRREKAEKLARVLNLV